MAAAKTHEIIKEKQHDMSAKARSTSTINEKPKICQRLETAFLALTALYLAYSAKSLTMFRMEFPTLFSSNLMLAMLLVALARLIVRRSGTKGIWIGLPLVFAYLETYQSIKLTKLLFFTIMVMGLEGIDHRKILKAYVVAVGSVLLTTIVSGLAGGIPNLVYVRDGMRSCWGTAYPTDFSSVVFFLALALWMGWDTLPDWGMLLIGLVPIALAVFVTGSRNCLLCGVLFEAVIVYHWLESGPFGRKNGFGKVRRVVDVLTIIALPVGAALIYLMVFLYARNPESMRNVDIRIFSERLSLSAKGFAEYSLTPFGTKIDMNGGRGFSVFSKGEFFFLDSSYVNILLRFGWVTLLIMAVVWMWMTRRAVRAGNRRMALVMAVIAIHSIMEHHFPDVYHNILIVMPLASLRVPSRRKRDSRQLAKRYVAFGVVLAALLLSAWLFLPGLISRLRTIFDAKGWRGDAANAWPVLWLDLMLVASVIAGAWAVYRLLLSAMTRRRIRPSVLAALAICISVCVGMSLWGNGVIDGAIRDNADLVETDADALDLLKDFEIYSDVLPEVYRQRYENIRQSVLGGDDLIRHPGSTVLTDALPEHRLFFNNGFRYTRISEAHAIYTADPAAIAALEADGYDLSDHFTAVTELDLQALATLNDLPMDEQGLLLNGTKQSLTKGLEDDLYSGSYVVEYDLFLPEGASKKAGDVCELRIAPKKQDALASVVVTRDQFDENGRATITVPLDLTIDTGSIDFMIYARKNRQVGVERIAYWQAEG